MKTIFLVDDSDTNLATAEEALEKQYNVMTMPSAKKMFSLLEKITPDLIMLDIEMPEISGFDSIKLLKANYSYRDIPVVFLTSRNDATVEAHGFELGAIDFITKPFSAPVLLNRIKTHLDIDDIIHERTAHLRQIQNAIIYVLADMVENRDKVTGGHIERTTIYVKTMLEAMLERKLYIDEIFNWDFDAVSSSARLHDVGKIAISDSILNKPGKLTKEEYDIMKTHVEEGEKIIDKIVALTGEEEFLYNAKLFAGHHHERWDGNGYPRGIKETEIPLQGRLMAISDVYDALVSDRPYKKALPDEEAAKIILEESGKQFDPSLVEVFYSIKDLFKAVREESNRQCEPS
jgi:putative two-component system response regulator